MGILDELYQSAIVEHSRNPRNHAPMVDAHVAKEGLNPSCGDELTLFLKLDGERVSAASFVGEGCAISQAAASLMTEAIKGESLQAVQKLVHDFKAMIRGEEPDASLGESRALRGVAKLPARVKCATLPWVTLELALHEAQQETEPVG